ncbi:MAG: SAM-dependent methyltransferase [Gammaproteobacteria bacterium]|nr:SAM-dependent methyltransferase [Gammaproteobacteria bacterium]
MHHPQTLALPKADSGSLAHSEAVAAYIHDCIAQAGGSISFAEYMHHCLYAPGLGYYAAGATRFGLAGDFVTAPEVSALFGRMLARQCAEVLAQLDSPAILEIGAGSGKLAVDILEALAADNALPAGGYHILEVSPDLQERQRALLADRLPGIQESVVWLDAMPAEFTGVIVANELLDALPVERFIRRADRVRQVCVASDGEVFRLVERDAPESLVQALEQIEATLGEPLPNGYASDVCLAAGPWVADLAGSLEEGVAFLFDYGVGRREYYAADRSGGWLRCHFRHHAHDDPLVLQGIQDLTSWVDFTTVAESAVDNGLEIAGFTSQAQFLLGAGLDDYLADFVQMPTGAQLRLSAEIKLLTLPTEMGENFKCLGLLRGALKPPAAFGRADRTATLG